MIRKVIKCPCCNSNLDISIDDSEKTTVIFMPENKYDISQSELSERFDIELGIVESEEFTDG